VFNARVLWTRLAGKVDGRRRAAIRVTLNQKVTGRLVMTQGKRTIRSGEFELKAGNRTFFVLLPKSVKKGRIGFQLRFTSPLGQASLRTALTLKA
jgi:hypothetical protein